MGTYHNATPHTLSFDLGDERYTVPPGAECEIPRRLEYAISRRGLPLTPGSHPSGAAPRVEATDIPRGRAPVMPPGVENGPPKLDALDAVEEESDRAAAEEITAGAARVDAHRDVAARVRRR